MIKVRITDPDCKQRPGAEVLRVSTDEYFRRFHEEETRKKVALNQSTDRKHEEPSRKASK